MKLTDRYLATFSEADPATHSLLEKLKGQQQRIGELKCPIDRNATALRTQITELQGKLLLSEKRERDAGREIIHLKRKIAALRSLSLHN